MLRCNFFHINNYLVTRPSIAKVQKYTLLNGKFKGKGAKMQTLKKKKVEESEELRTTI